MAPNLDFKVTVLFKGKCLKNGAFRDKVATEH